MKRQADGLPERLRKAREAAALTQAEAAEALRRALNLKTFRRQNIAYAEAGKRPVRADELPAFARAYKTTVSALLGVEHVTPPRARDRHREGAPRAERRMAPAPARVAPPSGVDVHAAFLTLGRAVAPIPGEEKVEI